MSESQTWLEGFQTNLLYFNVVGLFEWILVVFLGQESIPHLLDTPPLDLPKLPLTRALGGRPHWNASCSPPKIIQ